MSDKKAALRRSPRFGVNEELTGLIKRTVKITILDISEHGIRIESPAALKPAEVCEVTVKARNGTVILHGRVARCRLNMVKQDDGSIARVYHAGLEFSEEDCESEETKSLMSEVCIVEQPAELTTETPAEITEGKIVSVM